jgi:predicted HTH transcriptional regulator
MTLLQMTPLQVRTKSDLERIVLQLRLPESDSIEYKETLILDSKSQREEVLKDLTGMANGGSGVVVFGVSEDDTNPELPQTITPLTDRGLVGRLEDVARDGIRPPLLLQLHTIEYPPGFVLVAEVMRSPLGPYMVEAGRDCIARAEVGQLTPQIG